MTKIPRRPALVLGLLAVCAGLAFNPWSAGWTFSPTGHLSSVKSWGVIAVQALMVLFGIGLALGRPSLRSALSRSVVGLIALATCLFFAYQTVGFYTARSKARQQVALLQTINKSEDLIQWLTTQLRHLKKSAMNLELPDEKAEQLFGERVTFSGLASGTSQRAHDAEDLVAVEYLPVASASAQFAREELAIWPAFFETVDYFEHTKFYIVRGEFLPDDPGLFAADMGFGALAKLRSGQFAYVSGKMHVLWRNHRTPEDKDPVWKIESWTTQKFELTHARDLLFQDVLDSAVADADALQRSRRSIHEEMVLAHLTDEAWEAPPWFSMQSQDRHPGLAVVDLNGDGFDDLFVMARWGDNLFFMNRGDGTFSEQARTLGLASYEHTSSAIFADLDNDGDKDAILGRTLATSVFLINEDGVFVDRTATLVDTPLPALVSSVSVVDFDNDGLLDVYFSTYASRMMHQEITADDDADLPITGQLKDGVQAKFLADFLSDEDAGELHRRFYHTGHPVHDRVGPPNRLFRNLGDNRFELAAQSESLEAWHNTYQSTWADFDRDGDQDVYIANDFAPNILMRNDGGSTFTDVTEETRSADIGFGMGAGWGDYDNDGDEDLYIANMFSKAGRRITAQIRKLDPVFADMARGNSLLENQAGKFTRVSGIEKPALTVEVAGWSWGGQFVDFNNDGNLDVVALSGHYTAPKEVEIPVDT